MKEFWRQGKYNIIYYSLPLLAGLFCVVFSVSNFIILKAFNWVLAVVLVVGIILTCKGLPLLKTIRLTRHINDSKFGIVRLEQYTILKYGKARSGKSLTGVAESVYSALSLYNELESKYFSMSKLVHLYEYYSDEVFVTRFQEVERSYNFWQNHSDCIPCLFSNVKIMYHGLKSCDLTIEHINQGKWLPSYSMLFMDEIGQWIGVDKSDVNSKMPKANDFIRWIGQFCECHLIATEQRPSNVMTDLRGVIGVNERITKMSKVHRANLLFRILDILDSRAIENESDPDSFNKLKRLRNFANRVGFLKFDIDELGNLDFGTAEDEKSREMFLIANTEFEYDSRAFQNIWLAKDLADLNTSENSMLVAEDGELAKSIYARYEDKDEEKTYKKKKYYPF